MDIGIIIGLLLAFGAILIGFLEEGGTLIALLQFSAAIIVFGETFGALGVSFTLKIIKKFSKVLGIAFRKRESNIAAAGGYPPTMGIVGTVMGLVQVVGNLSDPTSLGPKIASAFMATLYGISSTNLFWLPVSNKLKMRNKEEINEKEMMIEAYYLFNKVQIQIH